ncbi:MAG: NAD(P)-dependent alcohol dehydrogenase [Steroidobacteraceae bacterium]
MRYKWLTGIGAVVAVSVAAFAFALARNAPCGAAPALPADAVPMRAAVHRCYGGPDVIRIEAIAPPPLAPDRMLVRVQAAAMNPLDKHYLHGTPYLLRLSAGLGRPGDSRMGVDFAGTVEAVGSDVTRFKPGDVVFGGADGAFGEFVSVREGGSIARVPAGVAPEQAASLPIAAVTALQALRDHGRLAPGQRVLVNGASGGVGHFAVQLAKGMGAHVTGVCSTRNVGMVRALGADVVIDYTREDFTAGAQRYDLIIDSIGNHPRSALRRVLTDDGAHVQVGQSGMGHWIDPLLGPLGALLWSQFTSQRWEFMLARIDAGDLAYLAQQVAAGKLRAVIDRRYPLAELPAAMRYLETGRVRGKLLIDPAAP